MNLLGLRPALVLRWLTALACWLAFTSPAPAQPKVPPATAASAPALPAPAKPVAPAASAGAGKAAVSLLYPPPYVIPAGRVHADLGLPVSVTDDHRASDLCVERAGVLYRNQPDRELAQRIQVAHNVVHETASAPELRIQFSEISQLPIGDYQVDMLIVRCAKPEQALQRLPVVVTRPGTKLEAPGKQIVDYWLATPFGVPVRTVPESITLRPQEDARASRVAKLAVSSSTFGSAGGVNVGLMKASTEPAEAGAEVVLRWLPADFPIGTATGNVTLSGNDLAAALRFDVEVRTRLHHAWIAILVALGVFTGWLVRVKLQPRAELAQSRETAYRQLAAWKRELDAIGDAEFAKVRDAEVAKLLAAIGADDKAALDKAQLDAKAALETARGELNGRLKTAGDGNEALRRAWDVSARLPSRLQEVAAAALQRVEQCKGLIEKKNAGEAAERLRQAGHEIDEKLRDALARLAADDEAMLRSAQDLKPLLAANTVAELDKRLEALRSSAKEAFKPPSTFDGLSPPLGAVAQRGRDWRTLLHELGAWLANDTLSLTSEIIQRLPKAEAATLIQPWLDALTRAVQTLQSDPGQEAWLPAGWSQACREAVDAATQIVESLPSFNPKLRSDARSNFETELRAGRLLQACLALPTLDSSLKEAMHPGAVPAAGAAVGAEEVKPREAGAQRAAEAAAFDLRSIELDADAQHRDWLVTTTALTLVAGALLTWGSVAAFQDKFIGTLGELLGLFLWGFSADLGLDKAIEKLRAAGIVPKA